MNPQPLAFGGLPHIQTPSDIELGTITAPINPPAVFNPTYTNFIDMQAQIGCCGAGAGKALQEVFSNIAGNPTHLSMEYLWKKIKDVDGEPLGDGTTLLGIMKGLNKYGVCTNALLPTNAVDADPVAFAKDDTTSTMNMDASTREITTGYAFQWAPSFNDIKSAIYTHKAVILLMQVGAEFWTNSSGIASWAANEILPLSANFPIQSGHFVLAYGYDENYIYFLNQWSSAWGENGVGWFGANYASRVVELGTAVDLATATFSANLSIGSTGSAVALLQRKLGIPADGIFGVHTKAAVEAFQAAHDLTADGIVGALTNNALNQ